MKRALDFIVIGAQKSGTTTLFDYLSRHPALELPAEKEAPFFSHDARFARGMPEYLSRTFPFGDPAKLWGTVTPQYMVGGLMDIGPRTVRQRDDPPVITVPGRIHALCPDARLIALLRDPTERAFSHYRQTVLFGWEQRPFQRAIEELLQPAALRVARQDPSEPTGYVVWGEYGRILAPYVELFGTERLLVLFTDELARNPAALLARIYTFLGVDPASPGATGERRSRTAATRRRLPWLNPYRAQVSLARNSAVRALWHGLPWRTRRKIDQLFARAAVSFDLWNRQREEEATMSKTAEAALRAHFREDAQRLADLTGRVPPWADRDLLPAAEPTPASRAG